MIGCQRTYFDMRHHMHLHALLENPLIRVFKSPPQILVLYVKVGSTKALNRIEPPIPYQDPIATP